MEDAKYGGGGNIMSEICKGRQGIIEIMGMLLVASEINVILSIK